MNNKTLTAIVLVLSFFFILPTQIETRPENQKNNIQVNTANYCSCKSKPDYYVEVALRQVYVTVRNKDGLHITDLKPEEFKLWEDGEEQKILAVDKVDFMKPEIPKTAITETVETNPVTTEAEIKPKRYFTLLIGNLPELPAERNRSRNAIMGFIENVIQPNDYLSLYILNPTSVNLIVPFNINPQASRTAIVKYLQQDDFGARGFKSTKRGRLNWSDDDKHIKNLESLQIMKSLNKFCKSLQFISGKKEAVIFSEGIYFGIDTRIETSQNWNQNTNTFENFRVHRLSPDVAQMGKHLLDLKETFAKYDVSLQVIDLGRAGDLLSDASEGGEGHEADQKGKVFGKFASQRSLPTRPTDLTKGERDRTTMLQTLSSASGGKYYYYSNTFNKIVDSLLSIDYDTSFYYILSYTSSEQHDPGTYLSIDVEVERDGADLGYKKGIIVKESTANLNSSDQDGHLNYMIQSSILYNMISLCSSVAVLPAEDKKANIVFGIQIPIQEIAAADSKGGGKADLDIFVFVFNDKLETTALLSRRLGIDIKNEDITAKNRKLALYYSTTIAPGKYRTRFFIRNKNNMLISSEEFNVNVPDFGRAELAISSPLLYQKTSDVIAVDMNATINEKLSEAKSSLQYLPGLYSISNEINNHRMITVAAIIKGLTKDEINNLKHELAKWYVCRSSLPETPQENTIEIDYKVLDIIEKPGGVFLTLFELDTRPLQKGEWEAKIEISKGETTAVSSIKLQII